MFPFKHLQNPEVFTRRMFLTSFQGEPLAHKTDPAETGVLAQTINCRLHRFCQYRFSTMRLNLKFSFLVQSLEAESDWLN